MKKLKSTASVLLSFIMGFSSFGNVLTMAEETVLEDDGNFLLVDFDRNQKALEGKGSEPENSVMDGASGKYLSLNPSWANWGYMLKSPIPDNGGDYVVSFDFAARGLSTSYYTVSLAENATMTGDNVYHQFGLLKAVSGGGFEIAGNKTKGNLVYKDDTWYHYELTFNQMKNYTDLVITERDNPEVKTVYSGKAGGGVGATNYGRSIPAGSSFDKLNFGIDGTIMIDNIKIEESREQYVAFSVESDHVGNIFDIDDTKTLHVDLRNVLVDPIKAQIDYIVYNEDGNKVTEGNVGEFTLNPREHQKTDVTVTIDECNVYDVVFAVIAENTKTGEKNSYVSGNYMLSVALKRDEGEPLNKLTAANIPYISTPEMWEDFKEELLQAGISGGRKDYTWYYVEPQQGPKGTFVESPYYTYWEDSIANGIDNMAILMASHPNYQPGGFGWDKFSLWTVDTPEMWEAWEKFIEHSVITRKDDVTYWEILNEPNERMSPEFYCKVMKTANTIIKKHDPDSIVLGLCTASMPWSWIDGVLKIMGEDWKDYCDAISIHPYDFDTGEYKTKLPNTLHWSTVFRDQNYLDKITRMREMMQSYGCGEAPLYITEIAITSTPLVISMKGQAAEFVTMLALTDVQDEIEQVYWYCFENVSVRGSKTVLEADTEGNFGMVGHHNDTVPLAAKPAYIAVCAYNKLLTDSESIDQIVEDKTRAYRFKMRDGRQAVMLWADEGANNIALNLGTDNVEILDMFGNSKGIIKSQNGIYDFTANYEPIYIIGNFSKMERAGSTITVNNGKIKAVVDDTVTFELSDLMMRSLRVEAIGTPYFEIVENTGIVNGSGKLVLKSKEGAFEEEPVDVKIYNGDELLYVARYYAVIHDEALKVTYTLTKDQTGADRSVVALSVKNETAGSVLSGTVTADFTKVGGKNEQRTIVDLEPSETKTVFLNIPTTPYIKSVATDATLNFGEKFKLSSPVSIVQNIDVAYNTTGKKDASVFDGEYPSLSIFAAEDELAAESFKTESKTTPWGGPDDCSFKGSLMWDEENLYIYCDVKDDVFFQKESGENIWQGDCLQIGVQDPELVGIGMAANYTQYTELGVAQGESGDEMYRWSVHPSTDMAYGSFDNYDVKIERTNGRTIYKMAIPWIESIGQETIDADSEIMFNIIANDNDGGGRRGFAVLTKGIGESKNATLFARAKLIK